MNPVTRPHFRFIIGPPPIAVKRRPAARLSPLALPEIHKAHRLTNNRMAVPVQSGDSVSVFPCHGKNLVR
jgi:hypothetical protein